MRRSVFCSNSLVMLLLSLALVAATGCDDEEPDPTPKPSAKPTAPSQLSITGTLDFGTVTAGTTATRTFTVTNKGKGDATLNAITSEGLSLSAPFALVTGGTCATAQVLAKDASCTLVVSYTPADETRTYQDLKVRFIDPSKDAEQISKVSLVGTGQLDCDNHPVPACPPPTPELSISDGVTYDFGTVIVSLDTEHTFTVTNTGRASAQLGDVSNAGLGLGDVFEHVGGTCATGGTVADHGGTCTITVRYTPDLPTIDQGLISLKYSGLNVSQGVATRGLLATGELDCDNYPVAACPPVLPKFVFTDAVASNYGNVDIGSSSDKTFTITNQGKVAGTMTDISDAGLMLGAPFSRVGGTCATGTVLAAEGGSCTLTLRFTPELPGAEIGTLFVMYSGTNGELTVTRTVTGTSVLNCMVAGLSTHRQNGVNDANADNSAQAALGTAAGNDAAYPTGYADGYQQAYPPAYANAYNQAFGSAYLSTYQGWYQPAYNQSCPGGTTAGNTDGNAQGTAAGKHDGYEDGYEDSYSLAYNDGYDDGYDDGVDDCLDNTATAKIAPKAKIQANIAARRDLIIGGAAKDPIFADPIDDPANTNACYNQGYSTTYNPSAYSQAYTAAVYNNPQYQVGKQAGMNQATTDAQGAGTPNGNTDGLAAAQNDGTNDGAASGYSTCYQAAYTSSYNSTYNSNYNNQYPAGYSAGDADGYNAGYVVGYPIGDTSCFSLAAKVQPSPTQLPRAEFGNGQSWMSVGRNGMHLDQFVQRTYQHGMLFTALNQELRNAQRDILHAAIQPQLRTTIRARVIQGTQQGALQ